MAEKRSQYICFESVVSSDKVCKFLLLLQINQSGRIASHFCVFRFVLLCPKFWKSEQISGKSGTIPNSRAKSVSGIGLGILVPVPIPEVAEAKSGRLMADECVDWQWK